MAQGRPNHFALLRIYRGVRRRGVAQLAREAIYRAVNAGCERCFGVRTTGKVYLADIGIHNAEWHEYAPVGYWAIASALWKVPLRLKDISLLDIGSGKGRPLVVGVRLGCRRVTGVDVVPAFNDVARANLAGRKNACIVDSDAAAYEIPCHVNVLYLANSFIGETLESLLQNIWRSYHAAPRPLYLIAFNARNFDNHVRERGHAGVTRILATRYYPGFSCHIYRLFYSTP